MIFILIILGWASVSVPEEARLFLSEEPLFAEDLRELGAIGDVAAIELLEAALERRLALRAALPLAPAMLDEEIAAALRAIDSLDEDRARFRAREVLERVPDGSMLSFAAREVLARQGEIAILREALVRYFDGPEKWRRVLSEAERASGDPRLEDFASGGTPAPAPSGLLRSRIERNLALSESRAVLRVLLGWSERSERAARVLARIPPGAPFAAAIDGRLAHWALRARDPEARLHALAGLGRRQPVSQETALRQAAESEVPLTAEVARAALRAMGLAPPSAPSDRKRALRLLVERDEPALVHQNWTREEIEAFVEFLAQSRYRSARALVLRVSASQSGRALAALLLSQRTTLAEKEEALRVLGTGWVEAVLAGGEEVLDEMRRVALRDPELLPDFTNAAGAVEAQALALVPGEEARRALEEIASAEAIEALMKREDRVLALPAMSRIARGEEGPARRAAERALLTLSAPGSVAIWHGRLARSEGLDQLAPALPLAPSDLAIEAFETLLAREEPQPDVFAALFQLHERRPRDFLPLLESGAAAVRRRAGSVIALSGDRSRLPLLVDRAVSAPETSEAERRAAFLGVATIGPSTLAPRLHRSAGDRDREIRFLTAVSLVPGGEPWTLRLLLAAMDEDDPGERRLARRALARLDPHRARELLVSLVEDGTATPFAIDFLLDLAARSGEPIEARRRGEAWRILSERFDESDRARLVASRVDLAAPARALIAYLDRSGGS